MPLIDLTIPEGSISAERSAALLDELATTLLHWEGAPDTDFFRSITWTYLHEIPANRFAVGGRPGGQAIQFENLKAAASAEREGASA